MERFGKKLKEYLASNNCTVYRLSKCTGLERTGLHRAISGQRLLPEDSLFKIMDFLYLTQREREELLEAYAIDSIGEDAYRQRVLILRLIDSLAHICLPQNKNISIDKQVEITSNIFSESPLLVHGKYKIINLVQICIEHDLYGSPASNVCLFLPHPQQDFAQSIIPTYAPAIFSPYKDERKSHALSAPLSSPKVRHLVSFSRPESGAEAICQNLESLNTFLPLSMVSGLDYKIFYYYGNHASQTGGFIFPYYIILNNLVILLSDDLQTANIQSNPEYVSYYREEFQKKLNHSRQLIKAFPQPYSLYSHCNTSMNMPSGKSCFIEYAPCFGAFADQEIIDRALSPQAASTYLENGESLLSFALRRIEWLRNLDSPVFLFTAGGLRYFMETGISPDLPSGFCLPICPEDRLTLLKRLKDACESGKQRIRLIHPRHFFLPEFTTIVVNEYSGIDFYLYSEKLGSSYLSVEESTLTKVFLDFAEGILDSSIVYEKDETVHFLAQTIQSFS